MRIKEHEINLLNILEITMEKCSQCEKSIWSSDIKLTHNSIYWTPLSKIVIVSDHYGYIDEKFWKKSEKFNYRKEEFAEISMVNCNIPRYACKYNCTDNIRKFTKIIDPEIMIGMGDHTHDYFSNDFHINGNVISIQFANDTDDEIYNYKMVLGKTEWGQYNRIFNVIDSILRRDR